MKCLLIVALMVMAFLSGCGRQLERGEILSKKYEPAYDYVAFFPMAMSCGNNCTTTMMIPYIVSVDESYIFTVQGKNKDGEIIQEHWYVDKATYDGVTIGSQQDPKVLQVKYEPTTTKTEKDG